MKPGDRMELAFGAGDRDRVLVRVLRVGCSDPECPSCDGHWKDATCAPEVVAPVVVAPVVPIRSQDVAADDLARANHEAMLTAARANPSLFPHIPDYLKR